MESGTRIVTLAPSDTITAVSFEDAFGEHSEFKGRGRARRQKRRMDRIAKKAERKKAKRAMRTAAMQERQERRKLRKTARVERRQIGQEAEPTADEILTSEAPEETLNQESDSVADNQGEGGGTGSSIVPEAEQEAEQEYEEESEDAGEEDAGFDGTLSAEGSGDVSKNVNAKVRELTRKVEWNKELVSRLKGQRGRLQNAGASTGDVDSKIAERTRRVNDLLKELSSMPKEEVINGFKIARTQRLQTRKTVSDGGSETPVASSLNPEFAEQKIVVPGASSSAEGTGYTSLDDYDAPELKTFELKSNAEGAGKAKMKIDWNMVAIGAAVAVAGIFVYNKYLKK